jgi:tRNA(Ile)-lysidine synthase
MARSRRSVDEALGAALAASDALFPPSLAPGPDRPLAVGFSGGLDSTVLLHSAVRVAGADRVLALHVHHGLLPDADGWVGHCADEAARLGVRFRALYASGSPDRGDSVEQWARRVRYRLLVAAAREAAAAALLTAHHADDQLETVLLALARGTGLDGLLGIAARDLRDGIVLMRPLLALDRADLLADARTRGLLWIDDPSNDDTRLPRNAIRHRLLPVLRDVLPDLPRRLEGTLGLLAEARDTLDAVARTDLRDAVTTARPPDAVPQADGPASTRRGPSAARSHDAPLALDRSSLAALPDARVAAVLRAWLRELGEPPPSRAKLAEVARQLLRADSSSAEMRHGGWRLLRHRDLIVALPVPGPASPVAPCVLRWHGEPTLRLPQGRGLLHVAPDPRGGLPAAWLAAQVLEVGTARSSERLRPTRTAPSRTLKNLFQEAGVPSWLRASLPALRVGERLLLAAPFPMDRDRCWPDEPGGLAIAWVPDPDHDPLGLRLAGSAHV